MASLEKAQEGLRLAENATKGPWDADPEAETAPYVWSQDGQLVAKTWMNDIQKQVANRDLIAHCGTHHADICRELIRLHEENERLRAVIESRPHEPKCDKRKQYPFGAAARLTWEKLTCTCWKSAALAQTGEEVLP